MPLHVLGVDPGFKGGGWAFVEAWPSEQRAVLHASGPVPLDDGDARRVDLFAMRWQWTKAMQGVGLHHTRVLGAIEAVESSPSDGRSSLFAFGRSAGALEGLIVGLGLRGVVRLPPSVWKARAGLPGGRKNKGASVALAQRLTGVGLSHDVAEAALIAWFAALEDA